jgi:hypothetical protein
MSERASRYSLSLCVEAELNCIGVGGHFHVCMHVFAHVYMEVLPCASPGGGVCTCKLTGAGVGSGMDCLRRLELEVGWGVGEGEICI